MPPAAGMVNVGCSWGASQCHLDPTTDTPEHWEIPVARPTALDTRMLPILQASLQQQERCNPSRCACCGGPRCRQRPALQPHRPSVQHSDAKCIPWGGCLRVPQPDTPMQAADPGQAHQ